MKVYYTTEEGGTYKKLNDAVFVVITDDDNIVANYDGILRKPRDINGKYFPNGDAKAFSLRLFTRLVFLSYSCDESGWFRLFGYGLHWIDTTKHSLLFSQRIGRSKSLQLGRWNIRILKPKKH